MMMRMFQKQMKKKNWKKEQNSLAIKSFPNRHQDRRHYYHSDSLMCMMKRCASMSIYLMNQDNWLLNGITISEGIQFLTLLVISKNMTFFNFNRFKLITSAYMNDLSSSNTIEQILCDRIRSTKVKMEKTYLRDETDRLWVQVETLQWALAQIRRLKQHL